jgi:RNA polymerase sigma-70 factor (ECF subfamily)
MASAEVQQFLETLRTGDSDAVERLLRQIDPFLRRIIRQRLIDGRLRRVVDTTDVLHSVVKDFLARTRSRPGPAADDAERTPLPASGEEADRVSSSTGQFSASPNALGAYLAAAVCHKLQTRSRKEKRNLGSLNPEWEPASSDSSPSHLVQEQDFKEAIRARLSEHRQRLFDLKTQGLTWDEIAERVGGRADALRMRLTRSIAVILRELEGAEVGHAP